MKTRVEKNNYLILTDYAKYPIKVNKTKTDKSLSKLENILNALQNELNIIYKHNINLYRILDDYLDQSGFNIYEIDDNININQLIELSGHIKKLKEKLTTTDDDINIDECIYLIDLGYYKEYHDCKPYIFTKVLEETDEYQKVDEIVIDNKILRRIRTIYWEKTEYGKRSTKITYRKTSIGKKLMQAILNTKKTLK